LQQILRARAADPAEIEALRRSGELSERQRAARRWGTIGSSRSWWKAKRKLQKVKNDYLELFSPRRKRLHALKLAGLRPPATSICWRCWSPSRLSPIEYPRFIDSNLFGTGDPARYPYENLTAYYARASYGQLAFPATPLDGTQRLPPQSSSGNHHRRENLNKEALNYYNSLGHDFTQYDNDATATSTT